MYKRIFMSGWVTPHFYVANHHLHHNGVIYFEKDEKKKKTYLYGTNDITSHGRH